VEWCAAWRHRSDVAVHHVAGDRDFEVVENTAGAAGLLENAAGLDYRLVGFEHRMPLALAACDLVVARAGASTVPSSPPSGSRACSSAARVAVRPSDRRTPAPLPTPALPSCCPMPTARANA